MPNETGVGDGTGGDRSPGFLASLLGVRVDEVATIRELMRASFLLGLALVLFYGSSNAIFLTRYDATVLPWVYIVNAIAVITLGLAYGAWSARVPVARALVVLSAAMTIGVAVLWLWATLSEDRMVAFVLATGFRLLFIFAVLGLWEIASAIFDIRQAKRLFSAIALGVMLAFVVGGLATPLLGSLLGTVNLVGLAAVCFALYTVDFHRLLRRHQIGAGHDRSAAPAGPVEILTDPYSRRMVWMQSVAILIMNVTGYVFYQQAAETFGTEASLAGFLGLFMGGMTVVMVLVTGLVSGRFISRFGIRSATLALPVVMLLVAVPTGFYGTVVAVDTLFFVFVCGLLASGDVVSNAIGTPAGAVLFQPMPPQRRMRVRLAVDGWLGSAALLVSGLLLLAFNAMDLDSVAPLLFIVAGISLVGVVVAVLLYRSYVEALHDVTALGFADDPRAVVKARGDLLDRAYMVDQLGSESPGAVFATTGMLRALDDDPLGPAIPGLLAHGDPWAVELALDAAAASGEPSRAALVAQVLERDDLPIETMRRALVALTVLDPESRRSQVTTMLAGPRSEVALPAALDDPELRPEALERLEIMACSLDASDRREAGGALDASTARGPDIDALLCRLLDDDDLDVVRAALGAAAGRVSAVIVPGLVRSAQVPALRRPAVQALATGGPEMVAVGDELLMQLPDDAAADVLRDVLGPHVTVDDIMNRALLPTTPSVRRRAGYEALARTTPAPAIRLHLADDLELLACLTASHRDLGDTAPVVRAALRDEFELVRGSIYAALAVEYGTRRLRDAETLVRTGDDDERANAIELLDVMLAADHRRVVIAALEPTDITEMGAGAAGTVARTPEEHLRALCDDPRLTSWTRRVAAGHLDNQDPANGGTPMDPTIERVLALRRVDIFATLPYDSLVELAGLVRTRHEPAGAVLIEAGDVGQELYAITSGAVEVHGANGQVTRLEEGTVVGELAVLDPAPRSARVTAATPVEFLVVPRSTVLALADRRPAVMTEIARVLARRLRVAG
jgi:hypothetical protein